MLFQVYFKGAYLEKNQNMTSFFFFQGFVSSSSALL